MAKDPVCGMDVKVDERTPRSTHAGTTYYFCSEGCKGSFDADPARYAGAPSKATHH